MLDSEKLKIQKDKQTLIRYAAERIIRIAHATLQVNETFCIALSGGSTPRPIYSLIASDYSHVLDWSRIHIFWGDERCVPPDDEQSNYRMTKEALLDHIQIPEGNIHRIHGEEESTIAASNYENELRRFFGEDATLFDMILLGMGSDGHTASLFPHTDAIHETSKWVIGHTVENSNVDRVTLTPPALLKTGNIMFIISGADKADALYEVLLGDDDPDQYPSQVIARSNHEHIIWALDEAAASRLPQDS